MGRPARFRSSHQAVAHAARSDARVFPRRRRGDTGGRTRPETAYELTAKGNLVAVVSNGTAILGLGDRWSLAAKPVMEGKGLLFKRFADIDVFDIEINARTPAEIIAVVKALEPTFGASTWKTSRRRVLRSGEDAQGANEHPVFHDDQHGTAIISGAGLMNALENQRKTHRPGSGRDQTARARARVACGEFWIRLGVNAKTSSCWIPRESFTRGAPWA